MKLPRLPRFAAVALATVSFAAVAAAAPLAITPPAQAPKPAAQREAGLTPAKPAARTGTAKARSAAPAKRSEPAKRAKSSGAPKSSAASKSSTARKTVAKPAPAASARAEVPLPRPRPGATARSRSLSIPDLIAPIAPAYAATPPAADASGPFTVAAMGPAPARTPPALDTAPAPSADDVVMVKQALEHVRRDRIAAAEELQTNLRDRVARKLIEWAILRADDNRASFARYAAFIDANPDWPNTAFLRRRAEAMLWAERPDPAAVRGFFARHKPLTARGRFALARALLAQGDRTAATYYLREAWRRDGVSSDLERQALDAFGDLLGAADHRARMHARFYADDADTALRMAQRLGGSDLAIARARHAVNEKSAKAAALLEAVPAAARGDAGYLFSRIQHLRRGDKVAEAGRLVLAAPRDPNQLHDLDEWWIERRLVARKLLDIGDAHTAYRVAAEAAVPPKEHLRAEHHFTAGWIALRFLDKPQVALAHFERVAHGTSHPITLARAFYWQGRAAEAAGHAAKARAHYATAARYPTAYYGQIARARLGMADLPLRAPELSAAKRASLMQTELVRAARLLYAADAKDHVISFMADLGDKEDDAVLVALLAELATRHDDARAALMVSKLALNRGLPLDAHAFPVIGIPDFKILGQPVDKAIVYAISRQESAFNPRAVSVAKAMGLMQVTAGTGRLIAKRLGVGFDARRLLSDPVYNAQLGAEELADMIQDYRGSLILTFVGYNAGRGRVREWIERYGDPRDPGVDPIDWVERIPFSETRNYVQRVLENVQVYRVRLGRDTRLQIEADLRRGASQ